jgi:hypothetical protein
MNDLRSQEKKKPQNLKLRRRKKSYKEEEEEMSQGINLMVVMSCLVFDVQCRREKSSQCMRRRQEGTGERSKC